jgi:hypothetical protein
MSARKQFTGGEDSSDHHEMSHVAMAAVAVGAVVIAGLVLIFASRQVHEHPGAVLGVILGVPALIAVALVIARRRRSSRNVV